MKVDHSSTPSLDTSSEDVLSHRELIGDVPADASSDYETETPEDVPSSTSSELDMPAVMSSDYEEEAPVGSTSISLETEPASTSSEPSIDDTSLSNSLDNLLVSTRDASYDDVSSDRDRGQNYPDDVPTHLARDASDDAPPNDVSHHLPFSAESNEAGTPLLETSPAYNVGPPLPYKRGASYERGVSYERRVSYEIMPVVPRLQTDTQEGTHLEEHGLVDPNSENASPPEIHVAEDRKLAKTEQQTVDLSQSLVNQNLENNTPAVNPDASEEYRQSWDQDEEPDEIPNMQLMIVFGIGMVLLCFIGRCVQSKADEINQRAVTSAMEKLTTLSSEYEIETLIRTMTEKHKNAGNFSKFTEAANTKLSDMKKGKDKSSTKPKKETVTVTVY